MFASNSLQKMVPYGRALAAIWLLIGTVLATPVALAQTQVQNISIVSTTGGVTDPNGSNNTSTVVNAVYAVTAAKSATPASGTSVRAGTTIDYRVVFTITGAATTSPTTFTDTLGAGLSVVPGSLPTGCTASGQTISCVLPAGQGVGTRVFAYQATVTTAARNSVTNSITGGNGCTAPGGCITTHPVLPFASTAKTVDTTGPVAVGDTITYTLTTEVLGVPLADNYPLTDTLGAGLTFGSVTSAGAHTCSNSGNVLNCSLPAGTAPGIYTVIYTATVNDQATGSVGNAVVGVGCTSNCVVTIPVEAPTTSTRKAADTAGPVAVGDVITYTLTTDVGGSRLTAAYPLTDTLGAGLTFGSVTSAGGYTCSNSGNVLSCSLPVGTVPGTYVATYTATVNDRATTSGVTNAVSGGGCTSGCVVVIPVQDPTTSTRKTSDTAGPVTVGDIITYTLTTDVGGSQLTAAYPLTDTLGAGLTFGSVTNAGAYTCTTSSNVLNCSLPSGTVPGTYAVTYTATVNDQATNVGVTNTVSGGGCTSGCVVVIPVRDPTTSTRKTSDTAGPVKLGDIITYTLTTDVGGSQLTAAYPLTDTLGAGLTFGSVTNAGAYTCSTSGNVLTCTLPAGTVPGTYVATYTATVNGQATTAGVTNAVSGGGCTSGCVVIIPVEDPATSTRKTSDTAGPVKVGDVITYTLTTEVSNSQLTAAYPLTDTLGAGLTFGSVTNAGGYNCAVSGNVLTCTLPAGTSPGTYAATYTATVNGQATTAGVTNAVSGGGCTSGCVVIIPVEESATSTRKTSDTAGPVKVGDVITYTLTTEVSNSQLTAVYPLTDTLGAGLTFGSVTNAGAYTCSNSGNVLSCSLPTGTVPGTYTVTYTATVNGQATTAGVTNAVSGGGCTSGCVVIIPVDESVTSTRKTSDAAGPVKVGDVITYTLTTEVSNSQLTAAYPLTDTLGAGLTFGSVTNAGAYACSNNGNVLSCSLPAGTVPGTYAVTYTATVNDQATNAGVTNAVSGGGCTSGCVVIIPVADPRVTYRKAADATGPVEPNDTVVYTLTMEVSNSQLTATYTLTDTLGAGLTFGSVTNAGAFTCGVTGNVMTCTLPAGTAIGIYTMSYTATVNPEAGGTVRNAVTVAGPHQPECVGVCTVDIEVTAPEMRVTKMAGVREVKVGDLVPYTLTVENIGTRDLVDGYAVDTPPAGFAYVEGSLKVSGTDSAVTVSGQSPLRFNGIDVSAGKSATLVYLMRVGAGVRKGVRVNQVQVYSEYDKPISNVATAEVTVAGDPLLEDSLIFGTVFHDRDGDHWQDSAALSGVKVQGGFAPAAYVANSTTVDRGNGPQPEPDASSPLLHGVVLDEMSGRQSAADQSEAHQMVIRQRLREPAFTDDLVLTNDQGVTVRMDAAGTTTVEKSGDAAKGLNAAAPTVERRVTQDDGGYVVDYIIRNEGIDEGGIPGVRIASVEGLLIETDQYGRYHLAGMPGGAWERGRNFILKVDPSTLPTGAEFTTDNPLLRRVTPGLPVRFDWGVKLPEQVIEGGSQQVELELGEVIFPPDSAEVRPEYLPTIEKMAVKVREYGGGELVVQASGETERFALARAAAVRDALLPMLDAATAKAVTVSVRGAVNDPGSLWVGVDEGGLMLGSVLFDTDQSSIRPEFEPLLDQVAARLERMGGGSISIIGHTDSRGSYQHNAALGMRRAKAVYETLIKRLSPDVRSRVRVEAVDDPKAPVRANHK